MKTSNESLSSLDALHTKGELDSCIDNQSIHCYSNSLERRMPDLWNVNAEHDTSVCSTDLYNSLEQKVERKKNLKLLELLETENQVKLPLISPCSQSCADEIKAESLFFDKYRNLNKIPRPTKMIDCINSKTLFNTSTLIDTAIHGTAEEKDKVIGTMKEYLGLVKEGDLNKAEPELSRNKYRTAVIDVGGTHYRTKIINFARFPASRLGKIFQARSTKEILLFFVYFLLYK